eukprot:snap_masked-scaffold_17-processed-gene-5.27-mRNA-1 protein AED:1.00 eAED:1.00 QI:0/-1/0/0/-1/1/1/0/63
MVERHLKFLERGIRNRRIRQSNSSRGVAGAHGPRRVHDDKRINVLFLLLGDRTSGQTRYQNIE